MAELKISEANKDDIAVWKNLQRYPAWKRLCREKQRDIEDADKIINTIGFDREKMFSERDVAIIKKQAIKDLIEYPETMISMLIGTGTERTEELDPYEDDDLNDDDL
jgi:PP-loop superfamily ATP-utilizing enzyme